MLLKFLKSTRKARRSPTSLASGELRGARRRKSPIDWVSAPDITERISHLVVKADFNYINPSRITCYRSTNAATRAYARIWGLGRIWQQALGIEPAYVIEVVAEKFDKLRESDKDYVLIHELLHIPKTFSGALVPHKHKGGVNDRTVREIYANIKAKK